MPKPVYIICASDVSEDRATNLVSLFKIIERLEVEPSSEPEPPSGATAQLSFTPGAHNPGKLGQLKVMAVWMKTPSDDSATLEHEFAMRVDCFDPPFSSDLPSIGRQTFTFPDDRFLKRFLLMFDGVPPVGGTSTVTITSRVRIVGSDEWISQEYPLMIVVKQPLSATPPAGDSSTTAD